MAQAMLNQFSHDYYNNMWSQAQVEFRQILADEKRLGEGGKEIPARNRQGFLEWLAEVYFQYLSVYKKFNEIYDQMVHPQKRPLVRRFLDLTLARLLEYQDTMMATELSEYLYYEDILNLYKYFPEESDLPIPKYYYHERGPDVELRQRLLASTLEEKELEIKAQIDAVESDKLEHLKEKLKHWHEDAVDIEPKELLRAVQTVERQRQGMLKFVMRQFKLDEQEREEARSERAKDLEGVDKEKAAVIVQKVVRGFLATRKVLKLREKELIFLGLQAGPFEVNDQRTLARSRNEQILKQVEGQRESRRIIQRAHHADYEKAQSYFESKIRMLEAAEMAEKMKFEMRQWLLEVRHAKGKLPDLPKAGDFAGFSRLDPNALPTDESTGGTDKNCDGGKQKKKKGDKERKQREKDKKKRKKVKKALIGTKLESCSQLDAMVNANLAYNRDWRRRNELDNEQQTYDESMIIFEKKHMIEREVRDQVNVLMKAELQHLRQVLEMKKKKKKGKKGKKGRKGKRGKGRKKKKKKKSKDLTPDRTCESLYQELILEGIIQKPLETTFNHLIGSGSLVNESIRKYYVENPSSETTEANGANEKMPLGPNPLPTFGDIKRALKDMCILPMGSETVHSVAPYTKSIFLAGPKGSGKKSLVYAICNELNATLFDFSPRNLMGKYEGKHGLIMLFHLLEKVGRWCQPMIIMIDMAEMAYMKRVPKTEQSEPKRIKKQLSRFIKVLSPEDRVLVFGLSSEPWAGKFKPMKKDYQKFIYIPKPNHGDRLEMWRHQLGDHLTEFNSRMSIEVLAKVTDCWTLGDIKECVKKALDKHYGALKRELDDHQRPFEFDPEAYLDGALTFKPVRIGRRRLDMNDFIDELSYVDPLFIEQEKIWNNWYCKTPLQKARLKFQLPPEDEVKKKKKGKSKSKKKKSISRKKGG